MEQIKEKAWKKILNDEFKKPYFQKLIEFIDKEYKSKNCYPTKNNIFKAFDVTSFYEVKVVLLGQDPYYKEKQAHGLSFSVPEGIKLPPTLRNIYKELETDINFEFTPKGDLMHWASQGVFLLNTTLTVEEGKPGSHQKKGWEVFTDAVIHSLSENRENLVFILWGNSAQIKNRLIDQEKHLVIESAHPSPLSSYRGFFGSRPFSKTNTYLESQGKQAIDWQL